MTSSNLPISQLINVDVILSPLSAQAQDLSTLLLLGTSDEIDVVERLRTYSTLAAVSADFSTTAEEYLAAALWFEQAPQPTQIKIGRWALTATPAKYRGATLSVAQQAIALWQAVLTPAFEISINGTPYAIAPASFAGVTNLNGVATIIAAALATAVPGTGCVWNSNYQRFQFKDGTTGPTATFGFVNPPTAVGNINFSVNPSNNDTITLNGTVVTFKSVSPVGNQVLIGATLAATLVNLLAFLQASIDANIIKFICGINGNLLTLVAVTPGVPGNSLTIAASAAVASGGTLIGGSGTDISGMLAMLSTSSGAYIAQGIAAESALAAATLFDQQFGQTWYALVIPDGVDADDIAVGTYIEGSNNKHVYGITTQEAGALSSVSTTDLPYLLAALKLTHTFVQYSSSNPYAVCSLLGRALTVDYNGNSTVITLMYKQEPGIVAESLTTSQAAALTSKNCNVFVNYDNNTAIVQNGVASSGDFIDTVTGVDWLAVTVMTALYNLLYTTTTKVPQTDAGTHLLVTTIHSILSQAVANGLLAPGTWNSNGFGTLNQGDFLETGFYVFAPTVASQLESDRAARKSVPIQVAAKLAGAIHTIDVTITVNR
jgi:hypothetical protein